MENTPSQFIIEASQIRGLSDELKWSQTYAQDGIIIILEIESDGSFSAKEQGEKITTDIAELIRKWKPEGLEAFKRLITQYVDASLIRSKINSLIIGYLTDQKISLICKMGGSAFIKRGKIWSELLSGEGVVSGQVESSDVIICETDTFQKLLSSEIVMERFTQEEDPLRAGESLGATLLNFDQSKGAAAVFAIIKNIDHTSTINPSVNIETPQQVLDQQAMFATNIPSGAQYPPVLPVVPATDAETPPEQTDTHITPREEIIGSPKPDPFKVFNDFTSNIKNKIPLKLPSINFGSVFSKKEETQNIALQTNIFTAIFASPKKRILGVAIVLSLVLIASIAANLNQGAAQPTAVSAAAISEIIPKVEEGEGLVDLNNIRARTLLTEAKNSLTGLKESFKTGSKERLQTEELLVRTEKALLLATKAVRIDNPDIFLDLTIVKNEAIAQNLAFDQTQIAVLDTKNPTLILVDNKTQAPKIIGGGQNLPSPRLITINNNFVFTISGNQLVRVDIKSNRQTVALRDLKEVGEATDMAGFGGNVYILDNKNSDIWKITSSADGYTQPKSYLTTGSLSGNLKSIAIDGSVWVLVDNSLKKFTRGAEEPLELTGIDTPIQGAEAVYTDDETANIYILDKAGSRVVVFDKDGLYQAQYLWSGILGVSDIVVSESNKKIYLLSANLIYSINLQ